MLVLTKGAASSHRSCDLVVDEDEECEVVSVCDRDLVLIDRRCDADHASVSDCFEREVGETVIDHFEWVEPLAEAKDDTLLDTLKIV